jgi:osmoprotectant transport system substrate-binding protein
MDCWHCWNGGYAFHESSAASRYFVSSFLSAAFLHAFPQCLPCFARAIHYGGLEIFYRAGGTLCQKALLSGDLDLYVEYTGTALTSVLGEAPDDDDSEKIYERVKRGYAERFVLMVTPPLGFANSFAMIVRGEDAQRYHLQKISDIAPLAPQWRAGFGYEFLERPDGYAGWAKKYGLQFAQTPSVMDLGLIYRALVDKKVDIVAGNSTDGLIEALHLVALTDDRHYFPPYDAVPIVRNATLEKFPALRGALADLAGKISEDDMRKMNAAVDADQRDVVEVVRAFRESKGL